MYPPKPSPQVSESVPEEVRKWLASTFAKQEQVIKPMMEMMMMMMMMMVTPSGTDQRRQDAEVKLKMF